MRHIYILKDSFPKCHFKTIDRFTKIWNWSYFFFSLAGIPYCEESANCTLEFRGGTYPHRENPCQIASPFSHFPPLICDFQFSFLHFSPDGRHLSASWLLQLLSAEWKPILETQLPLQMDVCKLLQGPGHLTLLPAVFSHQCPCLT